MYRVSMETKNRSHQETAGCCRLHRSEPSVQRSMRKNDALPVKDLKCEVNEPRQDNEIAKRVSASGSGRLIDQHRDMYAV